MKILRNLGMPKRVPGELRGARLLQAPPGGDAPATSPTNIAKTQRQSEAAIPGERLTCSADCELEGEDDELLLPVPLLSSSSVSVRLSSRRHFSAEGQHHQCTELTCQYNDQRYWDIRNGGRRGTTPEQKL